MQAFGLPIVLFYFLLRGIRKRGYWRSLPQRFGFLPRPFSQTGPGAIWLHAVSVGEVLSCLEFLRRLRAEFPKTRVFVSTSTLAGRATADEKLKDLADGVFYAPVDYVFAVRRVLRTLRPSVVVTAETEIWPNLFREVKRTGASLTLVNARISDKAYPKYLKRRWFFSAVLPALDSVLAQSEEIRSRFEALGMPAGRVRVAGNFKYDFQAHSLPADSPVKRLIERLRPSQIWIAASTMPPAETGDPDEDDAVIAAFQEIAPKRPGLLLILAPRKPERFAVAASKLEAAGIRFVRRSALEQKGSETPRVLLLDSIGELAALFGAADVVFMGGTLAHRGGHNLLEPALFAKPVIAGPHMENFQAIADRFHKAGAYVRIDAANQLAGAVERLLAAPAEAHAIGRRALASAEAQRGASAEAVEEVRRLRRVPSYRSAVPWFWVAWLLARVWKSGGRRRHRKQETGQKQLPVPVISIGNLTMGGTGKTPCVVRVVELLKASGRSPAILTRGYGRNSPQKYLGVSPGQQVSASLTGDEAQILIRSGLAPVGIGANRFDSGTRLLRDFSADVIVLDDGFQHRKLARDVDVLLIDALNPFGGRDVFPLGRLREPIAGMERASIILITRCEASDMADVIEREIRCWNRSAPVFRASVQPLAWVRWEDGTRFGLAERPFGRAGAFCGLGNPAGFRRTLESAGVEVADWVAFADHHRYRPRELNHIRDQMTAAGATALITTEKDVMNLCEGARELLAPLPLYWLQIGMRLEREAEFAALIEKLPRHEPVIRR